MAHLANTPNFVHNKQQQHTQLASPSTRYTRIQQRTVYAQQTGPRIDTRGRARDEIIQPPWP